MAKNLQLPLTPEALSAIRALAEADEAALGALIGRGPLTILQQLYRSMAGTISTPGIGSEIVVGGKTFTVEVITHGGPLGPVIVGGAEDGQVVALVGDDIDDATGPDGETLFWAIEDRPGWSPPPEGDPNPDADGPSEPEAP